MDSGVNIGIPFPTLLPNSSQRLIDHIESGMRLTEAPRARGSAWNNYEKIYEGDGYFKELDHDARVWRVGNDESDRIDNEMVDDWTKILDTLLIFAALFSAVVASFLTISAPFLQQDNTAVTASLLTELVLIQRAMATKGNVSAIPLSALTYNTTFVSTRRDIWLNGLWIASLVTTLITALMSGLIKQWLQNYSKDITGSNPKTRALTRQFRYGGLITWGVPQIIETLPVLMNISLFLFFTGLILFSQNLTGTVGVTWFLVGVTGITFMVYILSSLIPIWNPRCPYKTSLSKLYNGFSYSFIILLKLARVVHLPAALKQVLEKRMGNKVPSDDGSAQPAKSDS